MLFRPFLPCNIRILLFLVYIIVFDCRYGDAGLKSGFGGHDNHHDSNVYAYVGSCFGKGNNLRFANNTCVLRGDGGYASDCNLPTGMNVSGNSVYTPGGVSKGLGATVGCCRDDKWWL